MSVRKRVWSSGGKTKIAWVADYRDQHGKRHQQHFKAKREADAFLPKTRVEVAQGIHTPSPDSITVAEAVELWLNASAKTVRPATLDKRREAANRYILPFLGKTKLAKLTKPMVSAYCDALGETRTRQTVKYGLGFLKMVLNEAQSRGLVAQNVAQSMQIRITCCVQGRAPSVPDPGLSDNHLHKRNWRGLARGLSCFCLPIRRPSSHSYTVDDAHKMPTEEQRGIEVSAILGAA
jgi:hypothetical protein